MANVIVKAKITYRIVKKTGNKEISQHIINAEYDSGEVDEATFNALILAIKAAILP